MIIKFGRRALFGRRFAAEMRQKCGRLAWKGNICSPSGGAAAGGGRESRPLERDRPAETRQDIRQIWSHARPLCSGRLAVRACELHLSARRTVRTVALSCVYHSVRAVRELCALCDSCAFSATSVRHSAALAKQTTQSHATRRSANWTERPTQQVAFWPISFPPSGFWPTLGHFSLAKVKATASSGEQ